MQYTLYHKLKMNYIDLKKTLKLRKDVLKHPVKNTYYSSLIKEPKMRRYYNYCVVKDNDSKDSSMTSGDMSVMNLLKYLGFKSVDLDGNKGYFGEEKAPRKLGKFLKDSGLLAEEQYLKHRNNNNSKKKEEYSIVISANIYDIITCSYKRNWKSCLCLEEGSEFPYMLETALSGGVSMIAYLIHPDDKSIKNPLARVFLDGYSGTDILGYENTNYYENKCQEWLFGERLEILTYKCTLGSRKVYFRPADRVYGLNCNHFRNKLLEIIEEEINPKLVDSEFPLWFCGNYLDTNKYYYKTPQEFSLNKLKQRKGLIKWPPPKHKSEKSKIPTINQIIEHNSPISVNRWNSFNQNVRKKLKIQKIITHPIKEVSVEDIKECRNIHLYQKYKILEKRRSLEKFFKENSSTNMVWGDKVRRVVEAREKVKSKTRKERNKRNKRNEIARNRP